MTDVNSVDTTELDRQLEIINSGEAGTVQDFYDWLIENGYHIAVYQKIDGYRDEMFVPAAIQPEQLMADFFGIDRGKIEAERRALLDALRGE